MSVVRRIARPMLAAMFIYDGIDAVRSPGGRVGPAEEFANHFAEPLGLPQNPEQLVRINGAVQAVGGLLLAAGKFPRIASLAVAASLAPTTVYGHPFWKKQGADKSANRQHFLKNLGMMGGLLLAAVDTDGRPSVGWSARHAAKKVRKRTDKQLSDLEDRAQALTDAVGDKIS